ncbi:MAG: orotidine-5'-phosphate decarboxylase [Nanobdellota archaeon]
MEIDEKWEIAKDKICLPLDGLNTIEEIKERLVELSPYVGMFKIGKESYTKFGPSIIKLVQDYGNKVFLDLKYHDIPNTVKGAAKAAADLGVYMFNVHASGGKQMMEAAAEGVKESKNTPKILAVTILTSINEEIMNSQLNIPGKVEDQVLSLAKLSEKAGLDGIVCSAADLYAIKDKMPSDFMYVTPGIKSPSGKKGDDQKRVFTPGNAIQDSSSILVVGRAITGYKTKEERIEAAKEVIKDIYEVL